MAERAERATSTDYEHPRRLPLLGLYNRAAARLHPGAPLSAPALLAAAQAQTGLSDFGDPSFHAALQQLVAAINAEAALSPLGRAILRGRMVATLASRLRIEALHREHPQIAALPIERPLVIAGLQRTGTTLLHRLLAADPQTRALASWEALSPAPLPGEGLDGSRKRRRQARLAEAGLRALAPDFFAVHPVEADAPEEDVLLLDLAFASQTPEATLHVPSYAAWLEGQDLRPAYRYLRRALQVLTFQRSAARWVLKTPHHLEHLPALLAEFPGAVLIQTHRDPQATLASFCSMVAHARGVFSEQVDPREVGRHWLRKTRRMIDQSLAARDAGAAPGVLDVSYYDLLRDPLSQVRRIYAHAGLTLTPEALAAMNAVLARDRQHRHGRHVYRARDFGLSPARIEGEFAAYRARFAIPRERSPSEEDAPPASTASGASVASMIGHQGPVRATLSGLVDLIDLARRSPRDALRPLPADLRLDGKTALITGASSGLGHAAAIDLARRGARVILALRGGIPTAGQDIAARSGSTQVEMLPLDLADLDSVVALTRTLAERGERLDLLIANAGVLPARAQRTPQGFEAMFTVHYLANHLLIRRLLSAGVLPNDVYAHNGRAATELPRVVLVTSEAHRTCPGLDLTRFADFVDYGVRESVARYGYSKLAQTTFAVALARALRAPGGPSVAVHSLCPGPVDSRLAREAPPLFRPLLAAVMGAFFRSPQAAAAPVLYLAAAPELDGESGWYLHLMNRKAPSPLAQDPQRSAELWRRGEALLAPWLSA